MLIIEIVGVVDLFACGDLREMNVDAAFPRQRCSRVSGLHVSSIWVSPVGEPSCTTISSGGEHSERHGALMNDHVLFVFDQKLMITHVV